MEEPTIVELLNDLYSCRVLLSSIASAQELERQKVYNETIPQEYRELYEKGLIDSVAEFAPKMTIATEGVSSLVTNIKVRVAKHGTSVKGEHLQAIYSKGQAKWDNAGLQGYALEHPEIMALRDFTDPSVSIREIKK